MAVHVGELHTDVVAAEPPSAGKGDGRATPAPIWETDRRLTESAERAAFRRARVSADCFDD
jgi:hypothetical protein